MTKDNQKFIAFVLLGAALVGFGTMLYVRPLSDSTANSGVLQILNMIIGAFISGFGAATSKLFDVKQSVTIDNPVSDPAPTTATAPQPEEK